MKKRLWIAGILVVLLASVAPAFSQDGSQTHVVHSGENLFRISMRYGVSMESIIIANNLANANKVFAGQTLVIPGTPAPEPPAAPESTVSQPVVNSNPNLSPTWIVSGGESAAPAVQQPAAPQSTNGSHTVASGQTLAAIGRLYGLSWTVIAQANGLADPNHIYAGQTLVIPGASGVVQNPEPAQPAEIVPLQPAPVQPQQAAIASTHTVAQGETLAKIARAYGITWKAIASVNGLSDPNRIHAGQVLQIPAPGQEIVPVPTGPTVSTGKQIVVNLTQQMTYAYENGQLVNSFVVSTGLWGTPTVTGDYAIYAKLTSQTMSGPGYSLPNVPWVMYFYKGYSFHGTYWHNNFGQPMSHGCVNLKTPDSEWLFNWAPMGTPVHVTY